MMCAEELVPAAVTAFRALCVCLLVCLAYYVWDPCRRARHPLDNIPGPWLSLPVLGHLPFLGFRLHLTFARFQKKYGDIFAVQIGSERMVVLCGRDTIKAALVDQSIIFAGRPQLYTFKIASTGKSMCFNSFCEQWRNHRGLSERALRHTCMMPADQDNTYGQGQIQGQGQTRLEELVCREARALATSLLKKSSNGEIAINPKDDIFWSAAHVKYTLLYGNSRTDSADFKAMVKATTALISNHSRGNALNFFPWTRKLFRKQCSDTHHICDTMMELTIRKENEHLVSFQKDKCRDGLDALIQMGVQRSTCRLEQDRVLHTIQEYWSAGLDIVYLAVVWSTLYLAQYPHIQHRIWEEVNEILGATGTPKESHVKVMRYTYAFVLEVLRHSSLVPFALPHSTLADTHLGDIFIPSNTFILINLYSISRDPKVWPDPEEFRPERFLQENNEGFTNEKEGFYPFGLGARKCLGDKVSVSELFFYIATLVQTCRIEKPLEVRELDLSPIFGIVFHPQPFKVLYKPR